MFKKNTMFKKTVYNLFFKKDDIQMIFLHVDDDNKLRSLLEGIDGRHAKSISEEIRKINDPKAHKVAEKIEAMILTKEYGKKIAKYIDKNDDIKIQNIVEKYPKEHSLVLFECILAELPEKHKKLAKYRDYVNRTMDLTFLYNDNPEKIADIIGEIAF